MATMDKDFQAENWWATVSGAGTPDAAVESWADDYTRHRSGTRTYDGSTYSGTVYGEHSSGNQPADLVIGRKDSIQDVNTP